MSLLDFLSSLANGGAQAANPQGHSWVTDPDGYVTQAPQAPPPSNDRSDVVVEAKAKNTDPWKARKQTILGAIADGYMKAHGQGTPFADARNDRNMRESMEGFTRDPMRSIKRVGQFDPDNAWKMFQQETDNTRQQGGLDRQNQLLEFQKQKYVFGQLASMMGVASQRKDPQTWQQMRDQALTYANNYGIDASSIIPEQYDPEAIETIALGSVPVAKQMALRETEDYHHDTTDYRNRNLQERSQYHSGQLGLGAQRNSISAGNLNERQEHDDVTESQNQQRLDKTPPKPGRKFLDTKYGRGEVAADGQSMRIKVADPRYKHDKDGYVVYDQVNGQWRLRK